MIYRALIEGGNTSRLEPIDDAIYIFFGASTNDEARERIEEIFTLLFTNDYQADRYDCCNRIDEVELKRNSVEPDCFADAFLVETGFRDGHTTYVDDGIVFLVGQERQRVLAALDNGKIANSKT